MAAGPSTDRATYAPFILGRSLLLVDPGLTAKAGIFRQRTGWIGNGYDWQSVATTVLTERHPDMSGGSRSIPRRTCSSRGATRRT